MLNKRGMSPIVATVLLIAFAVALGIMVMSISVTLTSDESCESVSITWNPDATSFDNVCRLNNEFYPYITLKGEEVRCAKYKLDLRTITKECPTVVAGT